MDICVRQAAVMRVAWQRLSATSVPAKQTDNACLADCSQLASLLPPGARPPRGAAAPPPESVGTVLLLAVPAAQA